MQHDSLQQIAESHVVVLGKSLQDLEQALLHAHPGLHPLHQQFRLVNHWYQCTTVPRHKQWVGQPLVRRAGAISQPAYTRYCGGHRGLFIIAFQRFMDPQRPYGAIPC